MPTLVAAPHAADAAVKMATPSRNPYVAPVPVGEPAAGTSSAAYTIA